MWVYYGVIMLSVVMFGGGFALQDLYRQKRGSGLKVSMEAACIGALSGSIVLIALNGLTFEFTPFTLLISAWSALNGMAFTFCSLKALNYINLSLFSLFTMLGGMLLPFLQGILFYNEHFTLAKGVCLFFVCAALICTVEKGKKKKGTVFYAGVFLLNGMSGVISKIFTESELPKASATGYSVWIAAMLALFSGLTWLVLSFFEKRHHGVKAQDGSETIGRISRRSCGIIALYGIINQIANLLLVIALSRVDASIQYPMVTGGTMIVSTLIGYLGQKKINRREILSVALAFIGMLLLFLIPV